MSQMQQASEQPITAEEAKEKAKEKGQEVRVQASERLREQVQQRASSAGEQAQSLAQTVRRTGAELRAQGQQGQATVLDQVAMRAEKLGRYLTQSEPDQLLDDAREYGRRAVQAAKSRPWLAAAAGIGAGLAGSKLVRAAGGGQSSSS